jgi:uncharacterized iron-regulated protein
MKRLSLLAFLALACARTAPTATPNEAAHAPVTWTSRLDVNHPLVGRIFDPRAHAFVSADAVTARVVASSHVFLGEQHDNADHHRLQATLLGAFVRAKRDAGKRPSLVVEMLNRSDQAAIAAAGADPDAIAKASNWEHSGWPEWALYRPIFVEATAAQLPIIAAGLDRKAAHALVADGTSALDAAFVTRFGLGEPLAADVQARVRREMADAHCGMLPESMLDGMVTIQRARDAFLAAGAADAPDGAAVIAGNGHARTDSGAAAAFARVSGKRPLSVAFVEVLPDRQKAEEYAALFDASTLPFDVVWFTPRASDTDHCAEIRTHHAK